MMKNFIGFATILMIIIITVVTPQTALAQSTLVVDEDGQASATDCNSTLSTFSSIQVAVDAASPGDTIFICPGIFSEQVTVTTGSLTIIGSGVGQTVIRPSAVSVNSSGSIPPFPDIAAILAVKDTTDVIVEYLTINGSLADGGSVLWPDCHFIRTFTGINYRNSSGEIIGVHVTQIQSATACSLALKITSSFTSSSNVVEVSDSLFENYGFGGILCGGPTIFCSLIGNTILGQGPVDNEVQFGVGYQNGAGGELIGNIIADHYYSPGHGINNSAVGAYLADADPSLDPHILQNNIFYGNQYNVQRHGTAAAFK
jgi:hypothetical protein